MVMIKYDVSNVESGGGGEQPQPGLYKGKINSMTKRDKKSGGDAVSDLEVTVSVGSEYALLWTYVKLEDDPNYNEAAHGWKLRELTDALKLPAKGQFDPKKQEGKAVNVKVIADTNLEGEYRGRVRNLFPPGKVEEDGEDLPEGGDDEGPLTQEELSSWSNDDLKEELEERGLTIEGRFSSQKAIAAILDDEAGDGVTDEGDGDGEGNGQVLDPELMEDLRTDPAHYEGWEDADLATYAEDLGILGNISGRKTRAKYISAITSLAEAAQSWGDGAGEPSGDAEPDDYDEWEQDELEAEVTTRNEQNADITIRGRKTKAKLIEALRADDKASQPF